jgi:hypothetical protein
MKHYPSEKWADYSRGAADKRVAAEMKRHLETGCKKCRQESEMWAAVVGLAQKEPGYQPPESAVRVAKSYLAASRVKGKPSMVAQIARLIFDSVRQPQLDGVRTIGVAPRHYVYQAGTTLVDIWMEPASGSDPVSLTGQILEKSQPTKSIVGIDVRLRVGDAEIASTRTNQFGEFHLDVLPIASSGVQLTIGDEQKIAVLIPIGLSEVGESRKGD